MFANDPITKLEPCRADELRPGDRFIETLHHHVWVRTAKSDPQNRVLAMSLNNFAASYFGEATPVLRVVG